ncbi:putative ribonuclease H-like domain-containing protein [Tanacetum coccineum]
MLDTSKGTHDGKQEEKLLYFHHKKRGSKRKNQWVDRQWMMGLCSKEDSIGKPSYSRFTKTNDFKGVPPPLSGDYTPKPQEEIDDALYVYGKKGPQKPEISVSDENSSEHSTCQSNNSEGSSQMTYTNAVMGKLGNLLLRPSSRLMIGGILAKRNTTLRTKMVERGIFDNGMLRATWTMPDENQILLKVPRHHNMYSFDMKTPSPAKVWLGKVLDRKSDEGFLVGYSSNIAKPIVFYNLVTKKCRSNLHVKFLEEKPNVKGVRYNGCIDIDYLSNRLYELYSCNFGESKLTCSCQDFLEEKEENQGQHSQNSKERGYLEEPQQEMKGFLIDLTLEDNPKISSFQKETVNTGRLDHENHVLPRSSKIFHKPRQEFIDEHLMIEESGKNRSYPVVFGLASFMGFIVYQMDVKSAFLYGTIDERRLCSNLPGFVDPDHPNKVYKVVKALYGLHQAPRAWLLQRLLISLLSRGSPSYLRGQTTLGAYGIQRNHPFDWKHSSDRDYGWNPTLTRKPTTGGCQFLWTQTYLIGKCKKQTIVANLTTEAEYGSLLLCKYAGGQVLWFKNNWLTKAIAFHEPQNPH